MNKLMRILLTVGGFILVLLWRMPYYGNDRQPPENFNVFNQQISNDSPLIALGSALVAALLMWLATGLFKRKAEET